MGRSIVSFCGLCSMPATSRESQAEWNEITSECYSGFAHKACHVWSLSTSLVRVSDRVIVSSCPMSQDVPSLAVCFQEEDFLPPGSTMSRHKTEEHATLLHCCYMSIDAGGFHVLFVDLSTLIDIYEIKEVGELLSLDGTGFSDHIDVSLSSTVSGCWTVPWNPLEIHAVIQPASLATIKSYKII